MKKDLSPAELDKLRADFAAITNDVRLPIEYDGDALKVVRIGMNHKEAWPTIEQIIKLGYHIAGVTGNNTGMNQGFVLLERD